MGQAAQRLARLKGLQPLCVGPSTFYNTGGAVVLVARNFAETKKRMLAAVEDLMNTHIAVKAIHRLVSESQDEVGWIVVTYESDGGVLFQQLANSGEAIERVVGLLGEGYSARRRQWTAMVFGNPSDVETVRSLVRRFQDDVELSQPAAAPVVAVRPGLEQKVLLEIPRADVDQMNLSSALLFFDMFVTSIEVVNRMAGSVIVSFSGYDDDPRFLGEIPAVNAFLRQLIAFAPWVPLVLDTSCFMLFVTALDSRVSIKTNDEKMTLVECSPTASKSILDAFKWTMAEFLASRFFVQEVPASMRGNVLEWVAFLNSGPDVRPAPDWAL
jgi:hypothetical protein